MLYFTKTHDAFKRRCTTAKDDAVRNIAIYGDVCKVATFPMGLGIKTSDDLFNKSQPQKIVFGRNEGYIGRHYSLATTKPEEIVECMESATRDDLNIFMCVASPELLLDEKVSDAFFTRLDVIQKDEEAAQADLADQHAQETAEYKDYLSMYEGCVKTAGGAYFHRDSTIKDYESMLADSTEEQ